jgi:gliding-associated putative ABC transporter substrate-binding component GldG
MSDKISKKRKLISGANAAVVIVATVGIAIALNAISSQVFTRVDLTDNQIYTLSEASEEAVASLEEPVHVKAFISPDLPPPMHNMTQAVSDTLNEYAAASDDTFTFEIISPSATGSTTSDDIEEDAKSFGCEKVAIGQQSEDEVSLRAVFKCVAFTQGEDLEVVENLQPSPNGSLASFEYEFTKALLNLQETEPRTIGFVSGFGGPTANPQFLGSVSPVFEQLYGDLIDVELVDLSADAPEVAEDVSALIILSAEEAFSEQAIFALDQFVQRGGSVGWYQSATAMDRALIQQIMQQSPDRRPPDIRKTLDPGLNSVFKEYGVEIRQDLVVDPENGLTSIAMTQQGLAQVTQPGTFMMSDIDRTLPFARDFSALALPTPATVQIQPWAMEDEAIEVYEVIKTAETAIRRPKPPRSYSYESLTQRNADDQTGQWTVAAAIQGDVKSYYENNPLPEGKSEDELVKDDAPARILVVGSGDLFQPMPSVGYNEQLASLGGQFFISSIEWLVQDTALTQIRSKAMPTLLGEVPAEIQHSLQFVNIAAVPAVFAMIGGLMMMRRRRRREALDRTGSERTTTSDEQ